MRLSVLMLYVGSDDVGLEQYGMSASELFSKKFCRERVTEMEYKLVFVSIKRTRNSTLTQMEEGEQRSVCPRLNSSQLGLFSCHNIAR